MSWYEEREKHWYVQSKNYAVLLLFCSTFFLIVFCFDIRRNSFKVFFLFNPRQLQRNHSNQRNHPMFNEPCIHWHVCAAWAKITNQNDFFLPKLHWIEVFCNRTNTKKLIMTKKEELFRNIKRIIVRIFI